MRRLSAIPAPLLAGLIYLLSGAASGSASAQQSTFAEIVEVRVINLEAVVVDRQGRRVRGLGPADFALKVDGKTLPVEYFSEIVDGLAMEPDAGPGETLPPPAPGAAAIGERVGTSYLVFIDTFFNRLAARRNVVLRDIEDNLSRLGSDDRMAIVAFNGRRLEILTSWTRSIEELSRALSAARRLSTGGFITGSLGADLDRSQDIEDELARVLAEQRAGEDGESAFGESIRADGLPTEVCEIIERLERRIHRAVAGVTASLRGFAQPPGRKVMMLLSGGWPQSAKDYLVSGRPLGAFDCPDEGAAIYRPIYETANRLGYTLYPVDLPPPSSGTVTADEDGQQLFREGGGSSGPVGGEARFSRIFENHSTLRKLASETGGTALIGGAAETAFESLVDDTRTYYWLGFTPQWRGDDRSHEVTLEVLTPGLEVRTRRGYVDLSRQTEISYITESALLVGELPGALSLGLEIGALPARGKGKVTVPLSLTIPMDAITMLPGGRGYAAQLELRVAVVDDDGNRNDLPVIPVNLEGAEPPPPGAHAIYETSIRIRRRPHDIVVSLFDPLSDTILAASGSVAPASGGSGR